MKKGLIIGASVLALGSVGAQAKEPSPEVQSLVDSDRALVAEICKQPGIQEYLEHPEDICEISTDGGKTWVLLAAGLIGLAGVGTREYMIRRRKKQAKAEIVAGTGIIHLDKASFRRVEDIAPQATKGPAPQSLPIGEDRKLDFGNTADLLAPSEKIPVEVVSDAIRDSISVVGVGLEISPDSVPLPDTGILDFDPSDSIGSGEIAEVPTSSVEPVPETPAVSIAHAPKSLKREERLPTVSSRPTEAVVSLITPDMLRFVRTQTKTGISESSFTAERFGGLNMMQGRLIIKELQAAGIVGEKKNGYYPVIQEPETQKKDRL